CCFFFQAEDGIRDLTVTGVQTCALPISGREAGAANAYHRPRVALPLRRAARGERRVTEAILRVEDLAKEYRVRVGGRRAVLHAEIGRASCRESVDLGGRRRGKKKT